MNNPINLQLEPASIAACSEIPPELQDCLEKALQHQVDVFEAAKTHDIVLDLAPTGTGKTKAGLSTLKHNRDRSAVYIAPTNALIEQQTKAAEEFVNKAGLPHVVKAASAKQIKQWSDDRVGKRSGEKLYNVLREPATIFPECGGKPILLVTNPDIFYYATFFAYNNLDRANIASEFYSSFSTVIFDEFHLYDAKQLVSLFFYLALSHVFGYFQQNRKVILLTATPEPACQAALETLQQEGVKIAEINGTESNNNLIPSQTAIDLEIRPQPEEKEQLVNTISQQVIQKLENFSDQNGAVILDSKDTLNRISDQLRKKGLEDKIGRIIGNTPLDQRQVVAQKQVILATSTVDVGFNFEKSPEPKRQNLDWLIFSVRDRASFWQRLGRVGRVLGKQETNINSSAIMYLPTKAWEEGIDNLDILKGRKELAEKLSNLDCLQRPFLEVYWKSEAFLEIAKPLLELETVLAGLPQEELVIKLYQTLQRVLGGKKGWGYYRHRMKVIQGADNIAKASLNKIQKEWKYIKGGRNCVTSFLKANYEEEWEAVQSGNRTIEEVEKLIQEEEDIAEELLEYATIIKESYSPLFRFRDSLFKNVVIQDEHNLLLDEVGETNLDPIHLLRFLEFVSDGYTIKLTRRPEIPYNLSFALQVEDLDEFKNTCLSKLYAFKNITIKRMQLGSIAPTELPTSLQNELKNTYLPGVIVKEHSENRWAIMKLRKQGLECYPMQVSDYFSNKPEDYLFFPTLSGILAIVQAGFALKCPDNENFYIV
jgi:CRISPR-associated endonuclease/helicase Cas3